MLTTPVRIVTNASMASDVLAIQQLTNTFAYSIQAIYTGSPVGSLELQASNDYDPNTGIGTWTTVDDSENAITGAGSSTWNVTSSNYAYVRFSYDATSGSGTLNVYFYGRGF